MNVLWSHIVIDSLLAAGVQSLVVSPGSRSTPLVVAALQSELECFSIIDERQAAFFALGRANESEHPVALLCTSGTAGAHYLPALLEARHSGIPLLAITADRPPHLQDCSAPQTIDQSSLLASAVHRVVDLGSPSTNIQSLEGLRRKIIQAVHRAQSPAPGPIHINAPFQKPLEEQASDADALATELREGLQSLPSHHISSVKALASPAAISDTAKLLTDHKRGLITLGPGLHGSVSVESVRRLKEATGFELYCDITSNQRQHLDDGESLLGLDHVARFGAHSPTLVVQIGTPVISSEISQWTRAPQRIVIASHGWPDPTNRASVILGDIDDTLARLYDLLDSAPQPDAEWGRDLRNRCKRAFIKGIMDAQGEVALIQQAFDALPAQTRVILGNSLVVRVADSFVRPKQKDIQLRSQRGVSGIDGLIARSVGHSSAVNERVLLIVGDVSFQHDASSLGVAATHSPNLDILVVDNQGGQIFDHLPLANSGMERQKLKTYWLTPREVNIKNLAAAYDVDYEIVSEQDLGEVLRHKEHGRTRVLHARVSETGAKDTWQQVQEALRD